jgi:hypothetical protein
MRGDVPRWEPIADLASHQWLVYLPLNINTQVIRALLGN